MNANSTNIQISRMEKEFTYNELGPGYSEGKYKSAKIRHVRPLV